MKEIEDIAKDLMEMDIFVSELEIDVPKIKQRSEELLKQVNDEWP